jgi:hypothetical protein
MEARNALIFNDYCYSAFYLFFYYFKKYIKIRPKNYIAKQNPNPPAVWPFELPLTIILKNIPNKNPPKFPTANNNPTADPSPTGKTNSHPN